MHNHTSALPDHLYGPTVDGVPVVPWPSTLTLVLRGCLGVVAFIGIAAEIITLRRISSFMNSFSLSKPGPESAPTEQVRAPRSTQKKDGDLGQYPQLLFSFSICDMLQCGLCAPLVIFRKLSDFDMAWSWSDAIFRTIGSSHLLVIIFKIRQKLNRLLKHTDKQTTNDTNSSHNYRENSQVMNSSKFEGVLEVFVLWLVSIFVISMIFMLCQALKYFASFENSDRILLLGVLILAHFTPLLLLTFHGFKLRTLRNRVLKSASERWGHQHHQQQQGMHRDSPHLSDDSYTLVSSTVTRKNKTNFSTLSLAGSFAKKQRRSSWNSFRKKSGSSKNKNHGGGRMSPKLDRHPSLRYSIKRRKTSSLIGLDDFNKQQQIEEMSKPVENQAQQQPQNDDQIKPSQFLTVSPQRNSRSQKSKSFDRSDTEHKTAEDEPRAKTRRRRMRISSRTSASSGNDSGKSSRSSSRSDRSSSSGRLERHPSLKFSTRKRTPRSQEVLDGWKRQMSDEECGKTRRKRKKYFTSWQTGSHEVLHKSFKADKERSSERYKFGGSVRASKMAEGKKIPRKVSPRNAPMSRSHSHTDHKKLTDLDRHPSLKFSTQKISTKSSTRQLQSEDNSSNKSCTTNKFNHSSKNHLIPDRQIRHSASFRTGSTPQKLTAPFGLNRNLVSPEENEMSSLSQSRSYSTLRPGDPKLGRTSSCRGSFVRRTRDHHHHHHHQHHHHHHHSSFRIPNSTSNLHSEEMTFTPDDVTTTHLLSDKTEASRSGIQETDIQKSDSWMDGNLCFPSLERVILSTLLLNLPVAIFFLVVLFFFNPSESSETLVAHKLFSVCVSYAAATVRSFIIFRSMS